jgi:hypothetical protein
MHNLVLAGKLTSASATPSALFALVIFQIGSYAFLSNRTWMEILLSPLSK